MGVIDITNRISSTRTSDIAASATVLSADFQKAWKLENDAAAVMNQIWEYKSVQREEKIEAMITKIIAELKIEDNAADNALNEAPTANSFMANMQLIQKNADTINTQGVLSETDKAIAAATQKLTPLETQLDVYYAYYLIPKQSANPFAIGKQSAILSPNEKLQWGLLYLTTQFRRATQGYPLHAETYGLKNDVDCGGDLVSSQFFLKEGLSMLSNDYPSAVVFNNRIAAQTMCMSAAQLAVSDSSFVDAVEKVFAIFDANDRVKLMELIMNPLLLIYDAGKSQYSRIFDLLDDYRSVATAAYSDGSRLKKMGVYLFNYKTNRVQEVKFESPKVNELQSVADNLQPSLQEKDFIKNQTSLYGLDIKDLQKEQCQNLQKTMTQFQDALKSINGPPKPHWSGFVSNMSSGKSMGNGITPMLETFAQGLPDTGGVCNGGGGADGGDAGISCGMSANPAAVVKAQKCYANPPPFKMPTPGGNYMGGEGPAGPSNTTEMAKMADYNFKGSTACGSTNPYADDAPQEPTEELDADEKKRREALDKKAEEAKQKAQDKIDQEKLDKKLDDAAKANGQTPKGDPAKAKAKADAALKNAKTESDLKATTSGGKKSVTAEPNKSKSVSSSPCPKCPDGTNNLGGNTSVKQGKDGKEYSITLDREDAKGPGGVKTAVHEWAHAYLSERGVRGEDAHHEIMHQSGLKYCSPSDDSCSSGCNAQQVNMMGNYTCNDTKWGEGFVSAACSKLDADCKNPNDLTSDGTEKVVGGKVVGGGGGSSSEMKVGGGSKPPNPQWCTQISMGPDGVLPKECQGNNEGSGGDCGANNGGGLMAIDIFKANPNFGKIDPVPWEQVGQAAASSPMQNATPEKPIDSSSKSGLPKP
jgi:hypothetical protein